MIATTSNQPDLSATAEPSPEAQAAAFTTAVRKRLSDLPAEDLDELLDGLQGDLTERFADEAGGEGLGEAAAYADELRQAAGLPARGEGAASKSRKKMRVTMRESWASAGKRAAAYWDATAVRRAIRDFVLVLRPVWWLVRGVVVAWVTILVFATLLGMGLNGSSFAALFGTLPGLLLLAGFVIVSVQWGRGVWVPKRWLVWLRRASSVVAVIALIPAMGMAWDRVISGPDTYVETAYATGLTHGGTQIGNIFAYGCDGQPLEGVQLFTRDGEPLTTLEGGSPPWVYDENGNYQYQQNPLVTLPNGWDGWNVFPLQQAKENLNTGAFGQAEAVKAPFEKVPALSDQCAAPGEASAKGSDGDDSADSAPDAAETKTETKADQ